LLPLTPHIHSLLLCWAKGPFDLLTSCFFPFFVSPLYASTGVPKKLGKVYFGLFLWRVGFGRSFFFVWFNLHVPFFQVRTVPFFFSGSFFVARCGGHSPSSLGIVFEARQGLSQMTPGLVACILNPFSFCRHFFVHSFTVGYLVCSGPLDFFLFFPEYGPGF